MQTNNAVVKVTGITDKRRWAKDTFFFSPICAIVQSGVSHETQHSSSSHGPIVYLIIESRFFFGNSQLGIQINNSWRFLSDQSLVVGQTKAAFLPGCLFWRSWGRSGGTARRWLRSLLRFEWWNLVADAGLSALLPRAPRSGRRCHPLKASWVLSSEKSD